MSETEKTLSIETADFLLQIAERLQERVTEASVVDESSKPDFKSIARELHKELWDVAEGLASAVAALDGLRQRPAEESGLRRMTLMYQHALEVVSEHGPALGIAKSEMPWED